MTPPSEMTYSKLQLLKLDKAVLALNYHVSQLTQRIYTQRNLSPVSFLPTYLPSACWATELIQRRFFPTVEDDQTAIPCIASGQWSSHSASTTIMMMTSNSFPCTWHSEKLIRPLTTIKIQISAKFTITDHKCKVKCI